jgi:hypothetical protein
MRPIWTKQAIQGWNEVAAYILRDFGRQGLKQFKQRTKETELFVTKFPNGCKVVWKDEQTGVEYHECPIYHRSIMLYFVEDGKVYIADFWDVRSAQ